ncbi:hypothetical protein NUM_03170 [Actinocatenispora comari]|uniref:Orc1-like AAA ATPase domain-containing protein n=1 Tax=Actinocatenispora comari TaxID=2807577 RepID=A0A8J4A8J2_9ACTN|nr:hypothetical protein NUM_03170 [Actinocatenispora comari]
MVGRDGELRRLAELATAGRPEVVVIAGEPGIGKTRLVAELTLGLPTDTKIFIGHAEPGSLSRPYEVLLDAIDGRPGVSEAMLDELTDPHRSPVERLHTGLTLLSGHKVGPCSGRMSRWLMRACDATVEAAALRPSPTTTRRPRTRTGVRSLLRPAPRTRPSSARGGHRTAAGRSGSSPPPPN